MLKGNGFALKLHFSLWYLQLLSLSFVQRRPFALSPPVKVRDPYPSIGEKAVGRWGRVVSVFCITITLYGGGCVFIVLIAQVKQSLDSLMANNSKLFNQVMSPSLSCSG